jgi:DNA-binding PadR family transcriptional regulator
MESLDVERTQVNYEPAASTMRFDENGCAVRLPVRSVNPSKKWKTTLIDLQILSLLASIPMNGYELRKSFFQTFGVKISFGTIYPRLRYFERLNVIKPTTLNRPSGTCKIQYGLTSKGKADLRIGLNLFREILSTMEELVHESYSTTNKQVVTGSQILEQEI